MVDDDGIKCRRHRAVVPIFAAFSQKLESAVKSVRR